MRYERLLFKLIDQLNFQVAENLNLSIIEIVLGVILKPTDLETNLYNI
jgi:hypothetical protein